MELSTKLSNFAKDSNSKRLVLNILISKESILVTVSLSKLEYIFTEFGSKRAFMGVMF